MKFSPEQLEKMVEYILSDNPQTRDDFNTARQNASGKLKITPPSNRELFAAYQNLLKLKRVKQNKQLEEFLRKANIRSMSGIAVVTSLVKPYNCPGECVYCPTEVRMPKSYIASEPAAARALRLDFSPYEQMRRRILMLESNGHPVDKIEYIIKGGTWNAYPIKYQYWFILESFRACNDLTRRQKSKKQENHPSADHPEGDNKTKKQVDEKSSLEELQTELEKEQRYNENAKHRIIGLTLETRPDAISPKTVYHMRHQGCTRLELGLQAPDDKILDLVKRGHSVADFKKAILLLRQAGFKVDLHFMPDLPGTTPKHDVDMYKSLFSDPAFRPDMVKIYPNTVIPSAELYQWFLDGRYKPYGEENLFNALLEMKLATPKYCRISRLIRDIPANEIKAGNKITNLREELAAHLKKQGQKCLCLRCREIGRHPEIKSTETKIFVEEYETVGGQEYFLTVEDPKRIAVYAFLRLRIPYTERVTSVSSSDKLTFVTPLPHNQAKNKKIKDISLLPKNNLLYKLIPEIKNTAFIRELHTYGQLVKVGKRSAKDSQHKGLGKSLVKKAEEITKQNNLNKLAVISGVGVRGYYRKLGYRKIGTYMIKKLDAK